MSVLLTFRVPADAFVLGAALEADPDLQVTLERIVPVGGEFVPYLVASTNAAADIERALSAVDGATFDVVDRFDREVLVRVEWPEHPDGLVRALESTGGVVLEAGGTQETWTFRVRFDQREQMADFHDRCRTEGIDVDVVNIHNPGRLSESSDESVLTETQRATLELAQERGYFAVPRTATLTELAEELGVSDVAVSQRIRRGVSRLLDTTFDESE